MDTERQELESAFKAPDTPLEDLLALICSNVLGVKQVSINDNFFTDLGGHSLLATQFVTRLRDTLHIELPLRTLFEFPTITMLAAAITEQSNQKDRIERTAQLLLDLEQLSEDEVETMLADRQKREASEREVAK
jgi:acyl carrier protein